ncbi:MAG TPA: autotransporter domain-containing protein [Steroidobacteraceae bacterium]|nr:autotransporter domain-containing protein [Steroidobacteraceae bacterium]
MDRSVRSVAIVITVLAALLLAPRTGQAQVGSTAPTAVIAGGNRTIGDTDNRPGEVVSFDGSGSATTDPEATIVIYQWSINGTIDEAATGPRPSMALADGQSTVSLVVIDSFQQQSAPASVVITVLAPLTVQITGGSRTVADSDGLPGEKVPFTGSATSPGRTIPVSAFSWVATARVGTSNTVIDSAQGTASPTLKLRDGANTVTLNVTDPGNGRVTSATVTVSVGTPNPTNVPNPISSLPGLTPNQKAAAQSLERACNDLGNQYVAGSALGADSIDLLQQCRAIIRDHVNGTDLPGLLTALDAVSGQQLTSMQRIGLTFSDSQFKNLGNRLTELRQGLHGASASGLNIHSGDSSLPLQQLGSLAADVLGGAAGADDSSRALFSDRLGIFITGDIRLGDREASERESAFDLTDHSITVGADYRFTNTFVAGAAFGYGRAKSEFTTARLDSKNLTGSLYGSWYRGDWYVDFIATFGKVDYDSSRHIQFDSSVVTSAGVVDRIALGSTSGRQTAASVTTGYDWHWGGLQAGPAVTLNYSHLKVDGFAETGASGLDLSFDDQSAESVTLRAGGHLSYAINTRFCVILPHLQAAAVREFAATTQAVNVRFSADAASGYTILTDGPDRDYFNWSGGVSAQFPHGIAAFVEYQAMAGLALTSLHDTAAGLRLATSF